MRARHFTIFTLVVLMLAPPLGADRRRAAGKSSPAPPPPIQAAVSVKKAADGMYVAWGHDFTYWPVGTTIQRQVRRPDNTLQPYPNDNAVITINVAGAPWIVALWWEGSFPDWPKGPTTFEMIVTRPGDKPYTFTAQLQYQVESPTPFGPLEGLIVDPLGGVMLELAPVFTTPPTVLSPDGPNVLIPLQGGNYIPPGILRAGDVVTIARGVAGNFHEQESTSMLVPPGGLDSGVKNSLPEATTFNVITLDGEQRIVELPYSPESAYEAVVGTKLTKQQNEP